MSIILALVAAVTPLFVNHNRVVGTTPTMTNIQAWAASIGTGGGVTTNDVNAIIASSNLCTVAAAQAMTNDEMILRNAWNTVGPPVKVISIDENGLSVADTAGGGVTAIAFHCPDDFSCFTAGYNFQKLPEYIDTLAWRTTGNRFLSDYGITNAYTKGEADAATSAAVGVATNETIKYFIGEGHSLSELDGKALSVNHDQGQYVLGPADAFQAIGVYDPSVSVGCLMKFGTSPSLSLYPAVEGTDYLAPSAISASDPTFSNAVLAVGFGVSSNDVAVIREMVGTIGDLPVGGGVATLGGLLAALVASVVWLKTNALRKGLTGGVPDDPNVSTLFTSANTSLVAVCREYGGTQIKQDENGNFYYEVEVED